MKKIIRTAIPAALLCAATATASYYYLNGHRSPDAPHGGNPEHAAPSASAPFQLTALPDDPDVLTPAQKAAIGEAAADYLRDNPEVLVDVSRRLQAQQSARRSAKLTEAALRSHASLMSLESVPVYGPAGSKVIVTEFFDYQCSACAAMAPAFEAVMAANPGVRFAFRDWTIFNARWPLSGVAAARGLDVWRQKGTGAYVAYHNGIYRTGHDEGRLTNEDIETAAARAGTGPEDVQHRAISSALTALNDVLAERLGLSGTPGIVVMPAENPGPDNVTVFPGVVSAEALQTAIDKAEKAGG